MADASRLEIRAAHVAAAADALRALTRFEHPADAVMRGWFRERPGLGSRERAFVADTAFGVLRHLRRFREIAGANDPRRWVLAWLVLAHGRAVRSLEGLADRDETPWLASLKGTPPAMPPAVEASLPDWLYEALAATFDADALSALCRTMLEAAPLDLRVNTLRTSRDEVLAALQASGITARPCALSPVGVRIADKPSLEKHALVTGGHVEVQDEGSQLVAQLCDARRGQMVVDFCAGAGGKTLALGALMRSEGRLYAFDTSERRLANLKPRLKRSGLSNVHPQLIDSENDARVKRLAGKIDRVLVDAPCSGTGTLRRNPDIKWRQRPEGVAELQAKQTAILDSAARLPKVGGRLIYATCSLLREENEAVVERFLAARPQWRALDAAASLREAGIDYANAGPFVHLLPHRHGTDGFFVAVLERGA